ncbi:MAG TPA: L-histidine N(alpha)-methyltransferase [Lysobacter sp.]|nr:L-histidine N(alpha)-methyltransferase [Lysobacter sp.]
MNAQTDAMHAELVDLRPTPQTIRADVIAGLSRTPKTLPSKYFYDARGSALFERITRQPEYYLTRVERDLLQARMTEIADAVGAHAHVVEYGSGSARKTALLLAGLHAPVAYTAIDISRTAVLEGTARLAARFPNMQMLPVCADFTRPVALPVPRRRAARTLVFFPGSTLGNFGHDEAVALLAAMRATMGERGCALVGLDLVKEPATIEAAYNDTAGVTAAFTLNLLQRLNREIGSDFDLDGFFHCALYSPQRERVETFLVSRRAQTVHVGGRSFVFAEDEAMRVEYSHKYSDARIAELAARAGLRVVAGWNAPADAYALRLLERAGDGGY